MSGGRGVLMVTTARGPEPINRQRFHPSFLARHTASRLLGDGLVHAFSRTRERIKREIVSPEGLARVVNESRDGWAPFCASGLMQDELPGAPVPTRDVTCVLCVAGLLR